MSWAAFKHGRLSDAHELIGNWLNEVSDLCRKLHMVQNIIIPNQFTVLSKSVSTGS